MVFSGGDVGVESPSPFKGAQDFPPTLFKAVTFECFRAFLLMLATSRQIAARKDTIPKADLILQAPVSHQAGHPDMAPLGFRWMVC